MYLVVLYEVNTLLCDVVLHEFLLKKEEAQKNSIIVWKYKGGILVPLLQHNHDLAFIEQYYSIMMQTK
jgi:hypothetical protein